MQVAGRTLRSVRDRRHHQRQRCRKRRVAWTSSTSDAPIDLLAERASKGPAKKKKKKKAGTKKKTAAKKKTAKKKTTKKAGSKKTRASS